MQDKSKAAAAPVAWWNCGVPSPCPHELFAFAAIHAVADIALDTRAKLDRVAEAYIAYCRKVGSWAFMASAVPYHAAGEQGYRHRLGGYRAAQAYYFKHPETVHQFQFSVRFSKARQRRGMKAWGVFENDGNGLSRCVSDHADEESALNALRKLTGPTITSAAAKAA